jgi:hypothetical protein
MTISSRVVLVAALLVAGCGSDTTTTTPTQVMSASFANLSGANTSGVAISSSFASCDVTGGLSCTVSEGANGVGRVVSVSITGGIVAGKDYTIGGPESATVLVEDPTTFGQASGQRQWQSVPGTGVVHIVEWQSGSHVSFNYAASMRPLASPAAGTFDITGAGNIDTLTMH